MKLYAKFTPSGLCLELWEVEDHVNMPAPYVLQTPEVYAEWKAKQDVPPPPEPEPAPEVRSQATDIILQRLTESERAALFETRRSVWQLDYMMTRAAATGTISEADPDFPAGQAMLAQLGIIAVDRWEDLFA